MKNFKKFAKEALRAVALAIVKVEKEMFFRTGKKMPLLRVYFEVRAKEIQKALDKRAPEREAEFLSREAAQMSRFANVADKAPRSIHLVMVNNGATA